MIKLIRLAVILGILEGAVLLLAGALMLPAEPQRAPAPLPEDYYDRPCQASGDFYEWIGSLEVYGDVEPGGWDCSQMSAYIEWLAENCGHDAKIAMRYGTPGHSWVVIDDRPFEATGFHWIPSSWKDEYKADSVIEDIGDLFWGCDEAFYSAWGWWITYPELLDEMP